MTAPEQMRVGQHGGQQQCGKRVERKLQTVSPYPEPSFWRHFAILCQGNKLVVNHYIVIFLIMNVSAVIVEDRERSSLESTVKALVSKKIIVYVYVTHSSQHVYVTSQHN